MAKRFTATEKWNDPWFRRLPPDFKALWFFLLEQCDHAGIWKVDNDAFQYFIGREFKKEEVFKNINDGKERIVSLNCGSKWFIKDFVVFQYGYLNKENRAHQSVITILQREGVEKKGLNSPLQGRTDKDMVKDKDTDNGGDGPVFSFDDIWHKYPNKDGRKQAERSFASTVKTDKDWRDINAALDNYLKSEKVLKGYIKNGSTWFNNWRDWVNPTDQMIAPNQSSDGLTPEIRESLKKLKETNAKLTPHN